MASKKSDLGIPIIKVRTPIIYNENPHERYYIDGLVRDWSNSIANALELLQSFTKPLISRLTPDFF